MAGNVSQELRSSIREMLILEASNKEVLDTDPLDTGAKVTSSDVNKSHSPRTSSRNNGRLSSNSKTVSLTAANVQEVMENMKRNGSDEQVIASASAPRRPVAAETQQSRKKMSEGCGYHCEEYTRDNDATKA